MSERYSPKLLKILLRRPIVLGPFIILIFLVFLSGFLLLHPLPHQIMIQFIRDAGKLPFWAGDGVAFLLLIAATLLVIFAAYKLMANLQQIESILKWFREENISITQDMIINAIERHDLVAMSVLFQSIFSAEYSQRKTMINWLQEHRTWLKTPWISGKILEGIFSRSLDENIAKIGSDLLCMILREALNSEEIEHAESVLDTFCNSLVDIDPWTSEHGSFLQQIGFTLWKDGDYGGSRLRTFHIPEQLETLQWKFLMEISPIWYHVKQLKAKDAILHFIVAISALMEIMVEKQECIDALLSRIYDVLEEGFQEGVLTTKSLEIMINSLGHLRRDLPDTTSDDRHSEIDSHILAALAILSGLGVDEQTLRRAASNGYMRSRIVQDKWIKRKKLRSEPTYYYWLSSGNYDNALAALGLPKLSKKQAKGLSDKKEALKPVVISLEV